MTLPQPRFYVYVLARPDGRPFYVGKGQTDRVYDHERDARSGHRCRKCNTIRKIWKQGGEVQRSIVLTTDDEYEAFRVERETIALHGRENLCNLTDGGEGTSGLKHSATTLAKKSAIVKARFANPEERAKSSATMKAKYADPAERAKRDAALQSPETRAKRAAGIKAAWAKADREAWAASLKAAHAKPEMKAKHLAGCIAAQSTPEARARNSAAQKARYAADPESRTKHAAAIKAYWARRKAKERGPS